MTKSDKIRQVDAFISGPEKSLADFEPDDVFVVKIYTKTITDDGAVDEEEFYCEMTSDQSRRFFASLWLQEENSDEQKKKPKSE